MYDVWNSPFMNSVNVTRAQAGNNVDNKMKKKLVLKFCIFKSKVQ